MKVSPAATVLAVMIFITKDGEAIAGQLLAMHETPAWQKEAARFAIALLAASRVQPDPPTE